jgi:hypothetical protein
VRRLRRWLRWRIAVLVNRLPGQCWADLVSWALQTPGRRFYGHRPWQPRTALCTKDAVANGLCYCGKLRRDGSIGGPP